MVMRITDIITEDELAWYFINFSPLILYVRNEWGQRGNVGKLKQAWKIYSWLIWFCIIAHSYSLWFIHPTTLPKWTQFFKWRSPTSGLRKLSQPRRRRQRNSRCFKLLSDYYITREMSRQSWTTARKKFTNNVPTLRPNLSPSSLLEFDTTKVTELATIIC